MKIVLDTNVFVSGLFWSGPPATILEAWGNGQLTLVLSPAILDEYQRVIDKVSQKFENIDVSNILQLLETHATLSADFTLPEPVSIDPDDDKFIACAVSTKVKIIVSGDSDLLNVSGYAKVHVLKPKAFIDTYLKI